MAVASRSLVMLVITFWLWFRSKQAKKKYARWNHIAVFHHVDDAGVKWAIEAQPTGVAWRRIDTLGRVMTNADQPKTDQQRATIITGVYSMLKMPYDIPAIEAAAFRDLADSGVTWDMEWDGFRPPVHVICSSLASYWQWQARLAGPHSWRSTPLDWAEFMDNRGWEKHEAPVAA